MKVFLSLFFLLSLAADDYNFPDPYPEVYETIHLLPIDRHGWYLHGKLRSFIEAKPTQVVIEVGVWAGNCTIYLAQMLPENGKVFAVDHWLGSKEHQDPGNAREYALLPNLYRLFLSNVIQHGLAHKIIPVRMDSLKAAIKFRELNIRPDLIYLDAAHDYASALNDLEAWFPLLQEGGILCGDDWNLDGPEGPVSRAVKDFASKWGLLVSAEGEVWWFEPL